jgi:hypothetical protein
VGHSLCERVPLTHTCCCTHTRTHTAPAEQQPEQAELQALVALLQDREAAIRQGMTINGQRHEVCA